MRMTHLLCQTNDFPKSDDSCNRTLWHLISARRDIINPPTSPYSWLQWNANWKDQNRTMLYVPSIPPSPPFRDSVTWYNKNKEKDINELSYHSTQGFPRIERVFPRTWVAGAAAYISSASRVEWQSNIGEAITYELFTTGIMAVL